MQRAPYTLEQATALCRNLQRIVGYAFDKNLPSISNIECVAVSPYDQTNRKMFMLYYLLSGNPLKALKEDYKGVQYDIIVIAHSVNDENDLVHYDINTWLTKNNLSISDIFPTQPILNIL
ncbi:MAG TPA: hypothetical protein VN721_09410 [Flavipsychrobacter sp.]|nr:hypothetical protein [Flavipsychrobacter sp.]